MSSETPAAYRPIHVGLYGGNSRRYEPALRAAFGERCEIEFFESPASLRPALQRIEVLISAVFEAGWVAPRLRLLQSTGAGVDRVDVRALPADCFLANTPGHAVPMAEYVMLALLELAIGARHLRANLAVGRSSGGAFGSGGLHDELSGKTLCLLGFGEVGREVARRARAFDMTIGAVTRTRPGEGADWWLPPTRLAEAAARADALVVACPATPETRGLVDAHILASMPRRAVLVNVARASIVDEAALYAALVERRIAGAALDVWPRNPPPPPDPWIPSTLEFHRLENVLATPHASAWSHGLWLRRINFVVGNIARFLNGEAPLGQIRRAGTACEEARS